MKKYLLAVLLFVGCLSVSAKAPATVSRADSLAILLGEVQGAQFNGYWDELPDSTKQRLSKDDFMAGFKYVIERDYKKDEAYMMGVSTAMNVMRNIAQLQDAGVEFDKELFVSSFGKTFKMDSVDEERAMKAAYNLEPLMSEANERLARRQTDERELKKQEAAMKFQPNVDAGREYVEKQKAADPSIKTTESGVSYKVIKEGSGAKPGKTDMVKVKYTGKHIDGSVFDSSDDEPVEFNLSGVIPGFAEVIGMMSPGAEYVAYIPYDQAYGVDGIGDTIEPGETLVFEIELVEALPDDSGDDETEVVPVDEY